MFNITDTAPPVTRSIVIEVDPETALRLARAIDVNIDWHRDTDVPYELEKLHIALCGEYGQFKYDTIGGRDAVARSH